MSLSPCGHKRVRHDLATKQQQQYSFIHPFTHPFMYSSITHSFFSSLYSSIYSTYPAIYPLINNPPVHLSTSLINLLSYQSAYPFIHPLTQPSTHQPHLLIHLPTYSSIHQLSIYQSPFIHSHVHLFIHPFVHLSTHPFTHPRIRPLIHPSPIFPVTHLSLRSFIHLYIHLSIRSSIHSFVNPIHLLIFQPVITH